MTVHWHDDDHQWCPCDEPPELLAKLVQAIDVLVLADYQKDHAVLMATGLYHDNPQTALEQANKMAWAVELRRIEVRRMLLSVQSDPGPRWYSQQEIHTQHVIQEEP